MFRYDSYCGIFCGACGIAHATAVNDRICTEDTERCHGCKSDLISDYCNDCNIKLCAESKGLEFCFECNDFPCEIIVNFENDQYPHHSGVLNNLEFIRKQGAAQWLTAQTRRWKCPECGKPFTWYDSKCSNCGSELEDCRVVKLEE